MPQEFISEYGLDPGDYIGRLTDEVRNRCPKFDEVRVEEALFVDDGPIDYLVWLALENYETHTFFYHDTSPNQEAIQRFIGVSPSKNEMPALKALLRKEYDIYREIENATVLELPDTYLPQLGERPRAVLGFYHNPDDDKIVSGMSGIPPHREGDIIEDVDKLVPDKSIEKFVSRTVRNVQERVEEEAERHTISAEVRDVLEQDDDFRHETSKPLPKGINPKYTGTEAELWQKPASHVEYMDGSQGFLQVWLPTDDDVALVDATAGDYDREAIVDEVRKEIETDVAV